MDDTRQHVVITGGGGDLAAAIAMEFQDHQLEMPGRDVLNVDCKQSIERYFKQRDVDLLVCNAGITRDKPLASLTEESWDQVWTTNYLGAKRCAEAVIPGMVQRGGGHIVFISSYSAIHPPVGQAAYASSKAALLGLISDLSRRHRMANIRFNVILPGFMETRMTSEVTETRRQQVMEAHSLGRFNDVGRSAAFIRFLHLEMPHTSGQSFQLDSRPD